MLLVRATKRMTLEQTSFGAVHGVKETVRRLHNYVYANDPIKQHARVFDEIAKVMLAKLAWERLEASEPFGPTRTDMDDLAATDEAERFSARIERLYASVDADERREPIRLSPRVLATVAAELSTIRLTNSDANGAAFQAVIGPQLRTEKGQFFTPEPAKKLLAEILAPRDSEIVLDPACGSGGLLVAAATSDLVGIEIEATLARVARLGAMLHAERTAQIFSTDALAPWSLLNGTLPAKYRRGQIDVVITNPPFGSKARVEDPKVLADLPILGGERSSAVPELLFIERILQWLRPGGRAGIVLPLGVLANSSTRHVRDFIRSEAEVVATVTLPVETFRPAENGVQAALLFIRKRGGPKPVSATSFRAIVRKIGYDQRERPTFRDDGNGGLEIDEDLSAVLGSWQLANEEHKWF